MRRAPTSILLPSPADPGRLRRDRLSAATAHRADPRDAHATLTRGTIFLSARAERGGEPPGWPDGWHGTVRARAFANSLAELDRFLHVLLDAVAAPAAHAPDRHNAALKLGIVAAPVARLAGRQNRLRALGRSRASLVHLAGVARRGDRPGDAWMTAGWHDPETGALRRYRLGDRLAPAPADLADVCGFYDRLADDLLRLAPAV